MKGKRKLTEVTKLGRGRTRKSHRLEFEVMRMVRNYSRNTGVTLTEAVEILLALGPVGRLIDNPFMKDSTLLQDLKN